MLAQVSRLETANKDNKFTICHCKTLRSTQGGLPRKFGSQPSPSLCDTPMPDLPYSSNLLQTTDSFLHKKQQQCSILWKFILKEAYTPGTCILKLSDLLELAHVLEESIQTTLSLGILQSENSPTTEKFAPIVTFYNSPEFNRKQLKYSQFTLSRQLHSSFLNRETCGKTNKFGALEVLFADTPEDPTKMGEENNQILTSSTAPTSTPPSQTNLWVNDTSVSTLSSLILEQLQKDQKTSEEADEKATPYQPTILSDIHYELCQRFRFNIICHRGSVSTAMTLKLFKSFTTALQS
jgi:hypothetical protein